MRKILQPTYMEKFKCIGSACEDSCCVGWRVVLDKRTFQQYKDNRDEELHEVFQKRVTRFHSNQTDKRYGKIKMDSDGRCPFLNQKNLCNIYINIGKDYLSDTCTFYPRIVNQIDGMHERGATASCPEIARQVLLESSGIKFEEIEEDHSSKIKLDRKLDTEGHLFLRKPQRHFWEIRLFAISLLQNRDYTLEERLVLLGIIYKKIDSMVKVSKSNEIASMLDIMSGLIENGELRSEIENIPSNKQIQMRLAKELTDEKVLNGLHSKRYSKCLNETLRGIGFIIGEPFSNVLELYEKNHEEIIRPYLQEKSYVLENYLVNYYFTEMMPFGNFKSIWDSYMFLCVLYAIVKIHLVGMAGYHKEMTDDKVIMLIQAISKEMTHDPKYIQNMIRLLKENELDSLAYMSILVKG